MPVRANENHVLFIAILFGSSALGGTAGRLIELAGDKSQVPAAVVAGMMVSLLGWLFWVSRSDNPRAWVLASWVTIVFCSSLFVAKELTTLESSADNERIFFEELALRRSLLEWCSKTEFSINRDRARGGLPPLSTEVVCTGILPLTTSSSHVQTEPGKSDDPERTELSNHEGANAKLGQGVTNGR